jgi:MGS-like domain
VDIVSRYQKLPLPALKRIALVAHDNKKIEMLDWAKFNRENLKKHKLFGTGTTAALIEKQLDLPITKLESGPLGGDLQIGSRIAEGLIDFLVFSGIRWNLFRMTLTSRRCCVSRWFGIFPLHAIEQRQISLFPPR